MPTRAFLDSNVFLFGFELQGSNAHGILELLTAGEIRGVVTDRFVREVLRYLRNHYGKDVAAKFRDLMLLTCDLVLEADLRIRREHVAQVGTKDTGALAAVRELGIARLVSTDSDFEGVPERTTPRAFLLEVEGRGRAGEE